jgi:hypothetical protein
MLISLEKKQGAAMKAIWDWNHPRESDQDERDLVSLASDLGFDTIVINAPSDVMAYATSKAGMKLVAVISPVADEEFARVHPECLQKMLRFEDGQAESLRVYAADPGAAPGRLAHRWYPFLQTGDLLCYDQGESLEYLKRRIDGLLEVADGIALDGFGYKNHYACFCDHCVKRYGKEDPELIAAGALKTLVESSKSIYDYTKEQAPGAIVMNHIWPPFEPDPYYGSQLHLDYCTQTISWFYRPHWSLEHIKFEAAEHRRMQIPGRNQFVPFIGYFNEQYHRRGPDRVAAELDIALEYGDGNIAFSTLQGPMEDHGIRQAVQDRLAGDRS